VPVRTYTYTFSGGDVLDLAGWTDGNVMAHLIAGDSLEIELSNLAIARSQNAQIVDAARMLVSAHSAKLAKQREMVTSENIPPVPHPNDMSDEKMVNAINQLRNLSGAEFDRVWLTTQIEKHSMALKMIEGLEDVSRDDDLEDWVEESYTPIKDHLVHLNGLAPTFGVTAGVVTPKM
jgi:predicted outer membrane protein